MSALSISWIIFACLLGGAVAGALLRDVLPKHHLSEDSKYIVGLGTGLLATLAALVLGLLIASAQSSFELKSDEIKQGAAKLILLDRNLRHYGADADGVRAALRGMTETRRQVRWLENDRPTPVTSADGAARAASADGAAGIEDVQQRLLALVPTSDAQRWRRTRALDLASELAQMRWLVIDQHGSIPTPFLVALELWLVVIFASIGLFAPRNATAATVVFLCAFSVASSIFLLLELDRPFEGLLRISDLPLREAIAEMNRP
ncbi:MAG TPA: hypothetical protein VGP32_06175 [Steroidobacteraceae bacterium]|nr:hypothetical protein [Steroidobacteraceae bacterium]